MKNEKDKPQLFVPMALGWVTELPKNKPFDKIHAIYSLQVNLFKGNTKMTVSGIAKRFGWSRKRVRSFLDKVGLEIYYERDTKEVQKQMGILRVKRDRKGTEKGQKIFINLRDLNELGDRKGTDRVPHFKKSKDKRIKTSVKKDPKVTIFRDWFCKIFKEKFHSDFIISKNDYGKVGKQIKTLFSLNGLSFVDLQYLTIEFFKDDDEFLKDKAGYNFGMLLACAQKNKYREFRTPAFRKEYERYITNEQSS